MFAPPLLARCGLLLAALLCALPFLQPYHRHPLTAFYSEWMALVLGCGVALVLALASAWREGRLPWSAMAPLALAILLFLHALFDRAPYFGQALTAALYLLWAALLVLAGHELLAGALAGHRGAGVMPLAGRLLPLLLPGTAPGLRLGQGLLCLFQLPGGLLQLRCQRGQLCLLLLIVTAVTLKLPLQLAQAGIGLGLFDLLPLQQGLRMDQHLLQPGVLGLLRIHRGLGLFQRLLGCLQLLQWAGLGSVQRLDLQHRGIHLRLAAQKLIGHLLALLFGLAVLQRKHLPLQLLALALPLLVLAGLFGLDAQLLQLAANLATQIRQPLQVLARLADPALGLAPPLLVQADAGGLFQVRAQGLGLGINDLADHPLLDDRVAARPQPGAQEQVGDVAPAAA